jgi:imidazolonepropionase-like amidohydrolase
MYNSIISKVLASLGLPLLCSVAAAQDIAVHAGELHTVSGAVLKEMVVVIQAGKIVAIGKSGEVAVPTSLNTISAAVVTPGLVDAHTVVGVAGYLNQDGDQDQLEKSEALQPELRAIDAYNARERLVSWVRSFGVTTMHTGHGPGAVISGQTMIVKTAGLTVDQSVMVPRAMLAATLGESAIWKDSQPGTRGKAAAMLRALLVQGQGYLVKRERGDEKFERNLRLDAIADLLQRKLPLLVTAHRHQDMVTAMRIAREFNLRLVLDGAADAHLLLEEIKAAQVPVILHASMKRSQGEAENLSLETAGRLDAAGIPLAIQSGFESYVPKTRVILFEAAIAAANGMTHARALRSITLGAAEILGVQDRVGSIEIGKDGDLALYDGDPFEYTTHCVGTIIDGKLASTKER